MRTPRRAPTLRLLLPFLLSIFAAGVVSAQWTARGGGPSLHVVVDRDSIPENGGSSLATVSRDGGVTGAVMVALNSNDITEATVPAMVTLADGAAFTTFTVTAVDDAFADGTQTVTVTASAAGLASGFDSVLVTDNETDDHGDDAGSATAVVVPSTTAGNVENGGDEDWFSFTAASGLEYELETTLGSLSDSTLTLYASNGTTTLAFDDDGGAGLASRIVWTAPTTATYYVKVSAFGASIGTYTLSLSPSPGAPAAALTLDIAKPFLWEAGGVSAAIVKRIGGAPGPLSVSLFSSDPTEATVPATVLIPGGESSVPFTVSAVDDGFADGTQTVTVTATAAAFAAGSDTVQVLDDESDDHGNDAASATAVTVGGITLGTLEAGGDVDWFSFVASAGTGYEVYTLLGSLVDSTLSLVAGDGSTQLAFDDDGGSLLASRLVWTAPASGTYYVRVGAFIGTQTGTYSLGVTDMLFLDGFESGDTAAWSTSP